MLKLILGRSGTGKSTTVYRRICQSGPCRSQILIVPEQNSHEAERKLCETGGNRISLYAEVLSFTRLCSRIFLQAGGLGEQELDQGGRLLLMYHAVSDNMWGINELFVSPSDMEEQLAYLVDNGYDPIWFEDLAHVEDYDKPVILTFDDGYDDNYTELYPLLQKYQVKATIFVIGNAPGMNHKMTAEQIKEISDSGLVSIQSHAYTHDNLDAMGEDTLRYEFSETNKALTRITGKQPHVLCYPSGKYSDLTLQVAEEYYNFGLKRVGGLYNTSDDPFLVSRYYVSRYTDIYSFASFLTEAGT